MHRLFVAIDMPSAAASRLSGLCQGVSGAKWVDAGPFHLTLRFIGDADNGLLGDIEFALGEIEALGFDLALKGVGYFPPRGPAKILWAGIEEHPMLDRLRGQVTAALAGLGLEPERRNFAPHITLARFKRGAPAAAMAEFLSAHALFRTEPFPVTQYHLYSSHLRADGAQHRVEASYALPGADDMWG